MHFVHGPVIHGTATWLSKSPQNTRPAATEWLLDCSTDGRQPGAKRHDHWASFPGRIAGQRTELHVTLAAAPCPLWNEHGGRADGLFFPGIHSFSWQCLLMFGSQERSDGSDRTIQLCSGRLERQGAASETQGNCFQSAYLTDNDSGTLTLTVMLCHSRLSHAG